jgi:Tol biopolymer transport system component
MAGVLRSAKAAGEHVVACPLRGRLAAFRKDVDSRGGMRKRDLGLYLAAATSLTLLACEGDPLSSPTGTLEVTTQTTGAEPNPDGYTVQFDSEQPRAIGSSATLESTSIIPGDHTILLAGLADNCTPDGANPRTISIAAGETTAIVFRIVCTATIRIAFASHREGRWDIYLMNPDGSGLTNLTGNASTVPFAPIWSPEGSRIAFSDLEGMDVGLINPDGTEFRNLTQSIPFETSERTLNEEQSPAWSPDGRRIAFQADRGPLPGPANWDIYVVDVDGSGLVNLTESPLHDYNAAWSPDGRKIAYTSGCGSGICLMNADGTGKTRIPGAEHVGRPTWSPDGRKIMLSALVGTQFELHIVHVDGTGGRALVTGGEFQFEAAWSPDGSRIAFAGRDIEVMNSDGSGRRRLTHSGRTPMRLTWSPDGSQIAYAGPGAPPYDGYDTDIYLTDAEMGGETNLTRHPARDDYPSWSPR